MVDYLKVFGAVSNLSLNGYCQLQGKLDGERLRYKIYNDDFSEYLNLICKEDSVNITIGGNLRKWKFGSKAVLRDLTYYHFVECIELVAEKIGATKNEIWSFYTRKIEFGANLNVGVKYRHIFDTLIAYGKLDRVERGQGQKSLYFEGKKYTVKFYSKVEDVYTQRKLSNKVGEILSQKGMSLRVELVVKSKSAMSYKDKINTLGDIRDNFNYILYNVWLKIFDKVEVANTLSVTKELSPKGMTFTEIKEYMMHSFIKGKGLVKSLDILKQYSKYNKPNEKKELIRIFESYQTNDDDYYFDAIKKIAKRKADTMAKTV
ncbi:hypothetical protein [Corallibacter sp.]|uniref:hypothetical protein n=1 Tax=Corallibacter sp. TaxID=2038084 RepID=UPI003AB12351